MPFDDEALIARHIVQDPHKLGPVEVRLRDSGVSVWAVIGQLVVHDGDVALAAADYELSDEEMAAALAYFRWHKEIIEARLSENAGGEVVRVPVPV